MGHLFENQIDKTLGYDLQLNIIISDLARTLLNKLVYWRFYSSSSLYSLPYKGISFWQGFAKRWLLYFKNIERVRNSRILECSRIFGIRKWHKMVKSPCTLCCFCNLLGNLPCRSATFNLRKGKKNRCYRGDCIIAKSYRFPTSFERNYDNGTIIK